MRLQRNEHLLHRGQGVERQDAQRRGTVYEQVIQRPSVFRELVAEDQLAADDAGDSISAAARSRRRGDHPEVFRHLPAQFGQARVLPTSTS